MIARELNGFGFQEHEDQLLEILLNFWNAVAIKGDILGQTKVLQHEVTLEDYTKLFFFPNYRIPIAVRGVVNSMIQEMKDDRIVQPSNSPYKSPLLMVLKMDGGWWFVIDYWRLKAMTVPDRLPMPVISDVPAQLGDAKNFSSLDLLSRYWQVPLSPTPPLISSPQLAVTFL